MNTQFVPGKFPALIRMKCPRCHCGNVFTTPAIGKGFMNMNADCEVCKLHFEVEPGFFWGAMYVSYAITTAIMLIVGGALLLLFDHLDTWVYMVSIIGTFIIASPFTYRYSRMLMLYFFSPVVFEERYVQHKK